MGLDISVNVTVGEVLERLSELDNKLQENEARRILEAMDSDSGVDSCPGSYSGLHVVRREYALMKGWSESVEGYTVAIDDRTSQSHLISHSDCDGYYLPDDFDEPQWLDSSSCDGAVSVGSSVKLLSEVTELLAIKDKWPENFQRRWDAVFIVAVASVLSRQMVVFH